MRIRGVLVAVFLIMFIINLPTAATATQPSNGVAQPFYLSSDNYPAAINYNDTTYLVWNGEVSSPVTPDPYITYYDHNTKQFGPSVKITDGLLTTDYHGVPIIIIDDDGYIHVFHGAHGSDLGHAKSDNSEDITSWSDQSIPATNVTYPSALKHPNGDIYIFYRRGEAGFPKKAYSYIKSDDNGATWDAFVDVIDFFAENYAIYGSNPELYGSDQIHIGWRELHESTGARTTIYHAILNITDNKMYAIDGTDLGSVVDRTEAQANLIVDVRDQVCAGTLHLDDSGTPYMIYCSVDFPGGDFSATFARYTGSAWMSEKIVVSGNVLDSTSDFIVHSSTDIEAYITTAGASGFGGDMERWSWDGATWSQAEIILTESEAGVALNNPKVPLNYSSNAKMFFSEVDRQDYANADLKIYVYPAAAQATYTLEQGPFQSIVQERASGSEFVSPAGLLLSFDMETLSSGSMRDFSANDNDGTITGAADVAGLFGQARYFADVEEDYITVAEDDSLDGKRTIAFWFKPEGGWSSAETVSQQLVNHRSNISEYDGAYVYLRESDGSVVAEVDPGASGGLRAVSTITTWAEVWYHVATVADGSNILLYINGTLDVTGDALTTAFPDVIDSFPLRIGTKRTADDAFYNGTIDEILLFDRILNASEISSLANHRDYPFHFVSDVPSSSTSGPTWVRGDGLSMGAAVDSSANAFSIDVTTWNLEEVVWTSYATGDIIVRYNFTLTPSTVYSLFVNGTSQGNYTSDSNGDLFFTWTDWSSNSFRISIPALPTIDMVSFTQYFIVLGFLAILILTLVGAWRLKEMNL